MKVLKAISEFCRYVFMPQKNRNNGKTKYMELKEITEFFEYIRYPELCGDGVQPALHLLI